MMRKIMWFRDDLRLYDNTALYHASHTTTSEVVGLYIIDFAMWEKHAVAKCRINFIFQGLYKLSLSLNKLHIPLLIISIEDSNCIAEEIFKIMQQCKANAIYLNRQYEFNETKRDAIVKSYLENHGVAYYIYDDNTILPPGSVLNKEGAFFKNFTAYKRCWQKIFSQQHTKLYPKPTLQTRPLIPHIYNLNKKYEKDTSNLWPAGEDAAKSRLTHFIKKQISDYDKSRDFPFLDQTSRLSPYLATGMISPRECFLSALHFNDKELWSGNKGALAWMSELIWRDFYKHLLVYTPRISMNRPYKIETEKLAWKFDQEKFTAWRTGHTGFPIIDAAMRQLNSTGWMHNRLRMIVAMFFTKNLFFDWRLGENYFMQHLIDGDLAANNGGWQWCASTGTDSAPYFRVFNPILQSERFDPEGNFIRMYCPEIARLDNYSIHDPGNRASLLIKEMNYPSPIVNLTRSRQDAIDAFKALSMK